MERKNINGFVFAVAVLRGQLVTLGTSSFKAILVAADAKTQLQKVFAGFIFVVVVHHHAGVVTCPWFLWVITPYNILYRTRYVLLLHVQKAHAGFNSIAVRYFQYV